MRTITSLLLAVNVAALASVQPDAISTYAGGGPVNGPALSINLTYPQGLATTTNGEVYFMSGTAVYKLSGDIVILIAGTPGINGFSGDSGPATSASLANARGVAVDGSGNLYIAESSRIRKVSANTHVITTVGATAPAVITAAMKGRPPAPACPASAAWRWTGTGISISRRAVVSARSRSTQA